MTTAMNKKSRLLKDDRKSKARLVEELRAAGRKIAALQRRQTALNEEALTRSEARYRSLVETYAASVVTIDYVGNFTFVNQAFCKLLGYSEEELLNTHFVDFLHPQDIGRIMEIFQRTAQEPGTKPALEFRLLHKDGHTVHCYTIPTVLCEQDRIIGFNTIIQDITERKKVEETLRSSEARYRELFNHMNSGVAVYEARADGAEFVFRDFNQAGERMDKIKKEELIGKSVVQFFPGVKELGLFDVFQRVWKTGQPENHPISLYEDGRIAGWRENYIYRLPSGEIVAVYDDLTERKRAEHQLSISEERYRTLFNAIDSGFCVIEVIFDENEKPIDYRFLEINPSFEKQTGLIDALGKRMRELAPKHEEHWFEIYGRIAVTGQPARFENRAEALHRWYDVYAFRFGPPENRQVAILFNDITEQKRIEKDLIDSEKKYRSLFENMLEGYAHCKMIFNNGIPQDFIYLDVNRKFEELTGLKNVVGKKVSEVIPGIGESNPELLGIYGRVALTGKPERFETYLSTMDMWLHVSVYSYEKERFIAVFDVITERKQAEEALRKSESELRALSLELSLVEERERKRLALYLHDEIGQSLALLRMKLGSLSGVLESRSGKRAIKQIRGLLEKAIDQTHTLTFELSPPVLHQLGFEAAIEWAGEKISQDFAIEFVFSDDGMIKPLSDDIKTLLFRCVRELMSNTVKHAKAKRMTVSLTRREERIYAVVEDDGVGFDVSLLAGQPGKVGFGLFSVRERLGAVGGSHEFQSEPGRGTRITLSVPLKKETPSS